MLEQLVEDLRRCAAAAQLGGIAAIAGSKTSLSQRPAAAVSETGFLPEASSDARYRVRSLRRRRA